MLKYLENKEEKIFAYLTNSTTSIFKNEEFFEYKYIFTECTFLDDVDCCDFKHTCWKDLEPIIKLHPNNMFLLIHFSMRYSEDIIKSFFNKVNFKNITVIL